MTRHTESARVLVVTVRVIVLSRLTAVACPRLGVCHDAQRQKLQQASVFVDRVLLRMQVVSEVSTPAEEHVRRVELLMHENNVLTKQNAELDKEVARVNTDNEALAKQLLDATQQYGETCVMLKHKDAEVMNMASSYAFQPCPIDTLQPTVSTGRTQFSILLQYLSKRYWPAVQEWYQHQLRC